MNDSIHAIVRKAEDNYVRNTANIGEFVSWSMFETVEKIFAYLNSRHTTGDTDSLGREKPFFNVVVAAVNIWYRATDIDRKDIIVKADDYATMAAAFLATVHLQIWMRKARFGVYLNKWGRTLAEYGSAVSKFIERDGKLICSVIPWNRMICDPVDFYALPRIEKLFKTPAQLEEMSTKGHPNYAGYNPDVVKNLCDALVARSNLQGDKKDNVSEFVELYEVHGELSAAVYKEGKDQEVMDGDEDKFFQQMHVISYVAGKNDGDYDDFTLYCGKEKKDPYRIDHLIEEDGRTLAIGAVEYLFDAQWMQNHTMKNLKDTLDLSSKLIFQTADGNYVGQNVLNDLETGDIMIHADNKPLTQINNTKADVSALQNFSNQWKVLAQELTSTPDSLRGITPPSGTAYSTVALLSQQGNSLFEIMTENKMNGIEDMLREFIIPHLKTKMNNSKEVAATLADYDIKKTDAMYVPKAAILQYNHDAKQMMIAGKVPPAFNKEVAEKGVQDSLSSLGEQRFIDPEGIDWSEVCKDLEWNLDIVSNESEDKQAILTTLSTVLQTIASNPAVLQDPNARMVFNKILSTAGAISPIQLSTAAAAPPVPPAQAADAASGGSGGTELSAPEAPVATP